MQTTRRQLTRRAIPATFAFGRNFSKQDSSPREIRSLDYSFERAISLERTWLISRCLIQRMHFSFSSVIVKTCTNYASAADWNLDGLSSACIFFFSCVSIIVKICTNRASIADCLIIDRVRGRAASFSPLPRPHAPAASAGARFSICHCNFSTGA